MLQHDLPGVDAREAGVSLGRVHAIDFEGSDFDCSVTAGVLTVKFHHTQSFVIPAPVDTDDFPLMRCPAGITLLRYDVLTKGGTSVVGQLQEGDAARSNGVDTSAADVTANADTNAYKDTFTNATLDAGDMLLWKTTSVTGAVTSLTVTIQWRYT